MTASTLNRLVPILAATFAFALAGPAQDPVRFVCRQPVVRVAIHDLPALLGALPGTAIGKLFAEPDVAAAFALGKKNYAAKIARWTHLIDAKLRLDPTTVDTATRMERAVYELDWRNFRSGEMSAVASESENRDPLITVLLDPLPAAESRLAQRFDALRTSLGTGSEQKIDGFPATIVANHGEGGHAHARGSLWMLHLPGQFAGGAGDPASSGGCKPTQPPAPGIVVTIDVPAYAALIGRFAGGESLTKVIEALGLDQVGTFAWHLGIAGELLQDDISLELKGPTGGILGALLEGMAPLPDQPLPDGAMLQLRCSFDVALLARAVDQLLEQNQMPTLAELGVIDDLRKAWSGGVSLAVTRPAPGAFIPRLYASFGIVDQPALDRLLARLHTHPGLEAKPITYEGQPSMQLRLADMPSGMQPSYCVQNGTIHFAESGLSLRALLKSAAGGAPPVLDVGKAPRPAGPGAQLPGFELRFDGAAIHAAMLEVWMPMAENTLVHALVGTDDKPLVPMDEMPDVPTVTPYLHKGRGVLRRLPDRIVLSMSGTAGGPELHALLSSFGPFLSTLMTNTWRWQTENLAYQVGKLQIVKVHEAIAAFSKRTGKRPRSLGELLSAGDLKDSSLLLIEDDELAEPVVHDGKQLGKSSFRYYPDGVKVSPSGTEMTALLIAVKSTYWQRLVVDDQGRLVEESRNFALPPVAGPGEAK